MFAVQITEEEIESLIEFHLRRTCLSIREELKRESRTRIGQLRFLLEQALSGGRVNVTTGSVEDYARKTQSK